MTLTELELGALECFMWIETEGDGPGVGKSFVDAGYLIEDIDDATLAYIRDGVKAFEQQHRDDFANIPERPISWTVDRWAGHCWWLAHNHHISAGLSRESPTRDTFQTAVLPERLETRIAGGRPMILGLG